MLQLLANPKLLDSQIEALLRLVETAEKKKPRKIKLKKQAVGA